MQTPIKILLGTAAALALLRVSKKEDEEASEDEDVPLAATGFQNALLDAYERDLLDRQPVDLTPFEFEHPICGQFYQAQRGDTWPGAHENSITYRALYNTAFSHATLRKHPDPAKVAQRLASNAKLRQDLFNLFVMQRWGDEVYGTFLVSTKDPVGRHGRGIPLSRCAAQNRLRIQAGEAAIRIVPRGRPRDRGLGVPNRKAKHGTVLGSIQLARPYLWLSAINQDELLRGRVTTRGMCWEDGSTALEPPPQVVNLKVAVLG